MAEDSQRSFILEHQSLENDRNREEWISQPLTSPGNIRHMPGQTATSAHGERILVDGETTSVTAGERRGDEAVFQNTRGTKSTNKEKPTRRRSLLDAIAAEKSMSISKPTEQPIMESTEEAMGPTSKEETVWTSQSRRNKEGYRFGESRHPLLQATVDELAALEERSEVDKDGARAGSGLGSLQASREPPLVRTSLDSSEDPSSPDVIASPVQIPSLLEFGSLPSPQPPLSLRMKPHQYDGLGSAGPMRRTSRKTSAKSASSSWSPASAFLAQWNRDAVAQSTEPDAEGQELGDNCEYVIGKQIGYGGFSVVKEIHTFELGEKVVRAVKIVRKQIPGQSESDNEKSQNAFEHEVSIWRYLKHEHILPLLAVYDTPFATFCITQLNVGGTLFDLVLRYRRQASRTPSSTSMLRARAESALSQSSIASTVSRTVPALLAKRYIYQLACALRYLHQDVRVVHRDVKLENCLINTAPSLAASYSSFSSSTDNWDSRPCESNPGNILLCDFGMSDFISRDDRSPELEMDSNIRHDAVRGRHGDSSSSLPPPIGPGPHSSTSVGAAGSLQYASPELLRSAQALYEPGVDIWAFGITCYALLTGELPFSHGMEQKVVAMILEGKWDVDSVKSAMGGNRWKKDFDRNNATSDDGSNLIEADNSEAENALEMLHGCLDMDPSRRWDIGTVLDCHFLDGCEELYGVGIGGGALF